MKWVYDSKNVGGNLHDAARYVNEIHPEWDVVTMNHSGNYTAIVYRIPIDSSEDARLLQRIADALGTGETGDGLVEVARNAHTAEMENARRGREQFYDEDTVRERVSEALNLYGIQVWHDAQGHPEIQKFQNNARNSGKHVSLLVAQLLDELSSTGMVSA